MARQQLADLFLDTLPHNAITTASDALWAGLPVLTRMGQSFAARGAASVLDALGLPEMITHSREEYESRAIELVLNRDKLNAIKAKLMGNRTAKPMFDLALYTKHLEAAYEAMYRRCKEGLPPDHIEISG
jgi:predicted O-linked N-acetylglucosamine transferase (SPINDLY family)